MQRSVLLIFFTLFFKSSFSQSRIIPQWSRDFKIALNSVNKANLIKADRFGNVYVVGTTNLNESTKDIILIKYAPDGSELWHRSYNNRSNGDDFAKAMAIDMYGDVWICGNAKLSSDEADFFVTKFSNEGVPQFDYLYDGPNHLFDEANCIATDKLGNVYVAGYITSSDSGLDIMLMRFMADGKLAWKMKYGTTKLDIANSLVVDDSCNVYVCGVTNNSQRSSDIVVFKYDSAGSQKWSRVYDGIFNERDNANFITLDDSVNVYVTGFINHTNDRSDMPVLKYSRDGVLQKEVLYNGVSADCEATSLRIENDQIFVTGKQTQYNAGSTIAVLLKYTKGGAEKLFIKTNEEVRFLSSHRFNNSEIVFGTKLTHPESTLMPFAAELDTLPKYKWTFQDSTVLGISHFAGVEIAGDFIYYLGDDAGDATGTIKLIKYKFIAEAEPKKKTPATKPIKSGIPKNK